LLRKQQKTLGGYFFLPHPVGHNNDLFTICNTSQTMQHIVYYKSFNSACHPVAKLGRPITRW